MVNDKKVIENFITDAVGETKDEKEIWSQIEETIKRFWAMVYEAGERLPGTKFAISLPVCIRQKSGTHPNWRG